MSTLDDGSAAIRLEGLSKRFGALVAVDELSLSVPRGQTFGLLGVNGAGKSTTFRMMMGLQSIDAGTARVLDFDVSRDPDLMKQHVGYVPERPCAYPWMRVGEVIRFCRPLYARWNDGLCQQMFELFELEERMLVRHLSKGMATKLHLLLALAHEPEVLLLDEPLAGLDALVREEFLEGVLRGVAERDCTVVFSSHQIDDVQRLADRVGIIHAGRLLVEDAVDSLVGTTKRLEVVLVDGRDPPLAPGGTVWQQRDRRRWRLTVRDFDRAVAHQVQQSQAVERVDVIDLSLEDIFKDLVRGKRATV